MAARTPVEPVPEHGLLRRWGPPAPPTDPPSTTTATAHYANFCADCHGVDMDGGMASSLIDGRWDYGASDAAIFASIAVGIPEDGMPGFGAVMDAAQIDALVRLMREAERAQSH